jgi:hypothetical protein
VGVPDLRAVAVAQLLVARRTRVEGPVEGPFASTGEAGAARHIAELTGGALYPRPYGGTGWQRTIGPYPPDVETDEQQAEYDKLRRRVLWKMPYGLYLIGSRGNEPHLKCLMTANWSWGLGLDTADLRARRRSRLAQLPSSAEPECGHGFGSAEAISLLTCTKRETTSL